MLDEIETSNSSSLAKEAVGKAREGLWKAALHALSILIRTLCPSVCDQIISLQEPYLEILLGEG